MNCKSVLLVYLYLDDGRFQIFAVDDICIIAKIVVEGKLRYILCRGRAIVTDLKLANACLQSGIFLFCPAVGTRSIISLSVSSKFGRSLSKR